jgi:hypothetical protein
MKTFEVYIDRTETLLVQALDEDAAKDHAMGGEPDAPGCVLESFGTETNDVRAVQVADAPAPDDDGPLVAKIAVAALDDSERYRAALEQIAGPHVCAHEFVAIARRALGEQPGPFAQGIAHP